MLLTRLSQSDPSGWASWCTPGKRELPVFLPDHKRFVHLGVHVREIGSFIDAPAAFLSLQAREGRQDTRLVQKKSFVRPEELMVVLGLDTRLIGLDEVQLLKGNSSKWIHDTFREHRDFEWQEGYGAFSIGVSGVDDTLKYIQNQAEHHRKMTFKEEVETFLKKHGMEYVERDLE